MIRGDDPVCPDACPKRGKGTMVMAVIAIG
jgi:hypothetical protein